MSDTEAIILAAGYSSRAGTNKMLLKIGNKTVLERCIDSFYPFCSHIIVIGGYRIEDLEPVLKNYKKLQLVYNPHYTEGMFNSVKESLKYIAGDQFFLTPGDYPIIKKSTIEKMLIGDEPVIIPQYNGINGHPLRIKSKLLPFIEEGNFESLRDFIRTQNPRLLKVDDVGVVTDIDYIEDYYRILKMMS